MNAAAILSLIADLYAQVNELMGENVRLRQRLTELEALSQTEAKDGNHEQQ